MTAFYKIWYWRYSDGSKTSSTREEADEAEVMVYTNRGTMKFRLKEPGQEYQLSCLLSLLRQAYDLGSSHRAASIRGALGL